jgi:hypothetical protein
VDANALGTHHLESAMWDDLVSRAAQLDRKEQESFAIVQGCNTGPCNGDVGDGLNNTNFTTTMLDAKVEPLRRAAVLFVGVGSLVDARVRVYDGVQGAQRVGRRRIGHD